jgi:UDP-sugar transporter A1/2/3
MGNSFQIYIVSRLFSNTSRVPVLRNMVADYLLSRLVTLAVQNSLLTIIMHYSRVSTPPSRMYSAATAVLLNELLKGFISLIIAFTRLDHPTSHADASFNMPGTPSLWSPRTVLSRFRTLGKEIFSPDCWKLSIPAILYGASETWSHSHPC